MLVVLFGATAEVWDYSIRFFTDNGFEVVQKYCQSDGDVHLSGTETHRKYLSKEEFEEKTDYSFRYSVGGINTGFDQRQINEAIKGTGKYLMAMTCPVEVLQSLRHTYGEYIKIIYCYLDDAEHDRMVRKINGVTEAEVAHRNAIEHRSKKIYLGNVSIFDNVVIFNGEGTVYGLAGLKTQYEAILQIKPAEQCSEEKYSNDVFISYHKFDRFIFEDIKNRLNAGNISVNEPKDEFCDISYTEYMTEAIKGAKIFVALITERSVNSGWVQSEINAATKIASDMGARIISVIFGDITSDEINNNLLSQYRQIKAGDDRSYAVEQLCDSIVGLLRYENELKSLSDRIDSYISFNRLSDAEALCREHLQLCISGDTTPLMKAQSLSRLASVLEREGKHDDALNKYWEAWTLCTDKMMVIPDNSSYKTVACRSRSTEQLIYKRYKKKRLANLEDFLFDKFYTGYKRSRFHIAARLKTEQEEEKGDISDNAKKKIADYTRASIELFEELSKTGVADGYLDCLKTGYERIRDYCKISKVNDDIIPLCVEKISSIQTDKASISETEDAIENLDCLKVYLGKPLPKIGSYDVFISHKSEDSALAEKVYTYLRQNGKEVFFDKETLPDMHQSEYRRIISDAVDKARHMVVVASNLDYLKSKWVMEEWDIFHNEQLEGRKDGNITLVLTDSIVADKGKLPTVLRRVEIIKMSEFREKLINYIW